MVGLPCRFGNCKQGFLENEAGKANQNNVILHRKYNFYFNIKSNN